MTVALRVRREGGVIEEEDRWIYKAAYLYDKGTSRMGDVINAGGPSVQLCF